MKTLIKTGRYRHYKGKDYQVIGSARHSESEEDLVLYFPLYGSEEDRTYWVRPLEMFTEEIEVDGQTLSRFTLVDEEVENNSAK